MFNRLRPAIRSISYPYICITESLVNISGKTNYEFVEMQQVYGNIQNYLDGSIISTGRDQASIKQDIIFLCYTYLPSVGNPVYNGGTQTRVILFYNNHYYRLMLHGKVQDGPLNSLDENSYRQGSYQRYHGSLLNILQDISLPDHEKYKDMIKNRTFKIKK